MTENADGEKRYQALKAKLKFKLGVTEAMLSHCVGVAGKLKQAAAHQQEQAHYDLQQHGDRVRAAQPGGDPQADQDYCRALLDRHRMGQTYELCHRDERRFPDVTPPGEPVEKSLHRLAPGAQRRVYRAGEVQHEVPAAPDDFRVRAYDPQELLPREIERDKDPGKVAYFQRLFTTTPPGDIDPVVLVRTAQGRELLDGHHRWLGAQAAGKPLHGVEIGEATCQELLSRGFTEMDVAYAVLALADCWDAADKVSSQYDGRPVRRTGYGAYERLREAR